MKLTNEEIAKVFAMHLGCELQVRNPYCDSENKILNAVKLEDKDDFNINIFYKNEQYLDESTWNDFTRAKMILKNLSNLTDQECNEINKLNDWFDYEEYFTAMEKVKGGDISSLTYPSIRFLISRDYDVPIWFGIDHWANNKTATELGIAIQQTI